MDTPIDTRQLRAFAALARAGSFTQAGRELHLTQSAVSHAIKALERDLDCQLFHRQGKRVFLTHHGQELLPLSESIFQMMEQARERLGALDHRMRGRLRIGCTTGASQYILPTVLREFKESFPLYEIRVVPGETPDTIERLLNHEIDVSVALRPQDTVRLQCHPIFEDELELLVSPLHPWAKKNPKLKELADHTLIVSSRNSLTFTMVSEYFLKQGVRLHSFIELGSTEAIKELAKLGIGVAVAARWTVREELKSGQLQAISLPRGKIKRQWVACALKDRPLSLAESTFIGLCEQVGRKMEK
jgi:DNA-binding transcriptional LysR family regulator